MNFFDNIPPITKNIIIINIIVFLLQSTIPGFTENFALHFYKSPDFRPYQLITHMFMHGGFQHILFNMFGVYMFGAAIEQRLGGQKFLLYYLLTGFGAVILHFISQYFEATDIIAQIESYQASENASLQQIANAYRSFFAITLGASGALFGLLAAFAILYPNQRIMLLFFPVPIKAKYFVLGYAAIELFSGFTARGDGIAHFAHLGGALFGFLILREWKKRRMI